MTFSIEIGGRVRAISLERVAGEGAGGGQFRATLDAGDGREPASLIIDAERTALGWSLVYDHARRVVDAAVTDRPHGVVLIQLPHVSLTAAVDGRRFRRGGSGAVAPGRAERVVAPMPGRIVRVLVAVGDEVAARQGLVVVEAMKMENELSATRPGRVAEIAVVEGESVEAGRLLVRVD